MEIRARAAEDLERLAAVAARVQMEDRYPIALPAGGFGAFLTTPEPVAAWVAVVGDELVGHVALNGVTSRPVVQLVEHLRIGGGTPIYVARLLVDPDSRRAGIGGALLRHALDAAVAAKWSAYLDVVDTPTAAPAIALYRRSRWTEIGSVAFELGGCDIEELVFAAPTT